MQGVKADIVRRDKKDTVEGVMKEYLQLLPPHLRMTSQDKLLEVQVSTRSSARYSPWSRDVPSESVLVEVVPPRSSSSMVSSTGGIGAGAGTSGAGTSGAGSSSAGDRSDAGGSTVRQCRRVYIANLYSVIGVRAEASALAVCACF